MFGFIKQHLDQKLAREAEAAVERRARQMAPKAAPVAQPLDRDSAIVKMQAGLKDRPSDDRKALLANALAVHRAKQKIFDHLDDESRAKLVAMAITTLLAQAEGQKK